MVERHLPPAPRAAEPNLGETALPAETDDRPLGPRLTGILLLKSDRPSSVVRGVRAMDFTPPRATALVQELEGLLNRPLSRKLVASAVAVVTRSYRAANRPLVSVTTPPQDLSAGVLRLQVVEFVAGQLGTRVANDADAQAVVNGVRFPRGQPINSRKLRQDLVWLDRYPFRKSGAVFSPGAEPGVTDLTVTVASQRPWQAFAGVTTSDAPSSGDVRVFGGFVAGGLIEPGSVLSVQATASGLADPRYWSVAARLVEPVGSRREMSVLVAHVHGRSATAPFASRAETTEVALDLRFALPPSLLGDAHLGIEMGHQRIHTRFAGLPVYDVQATAFAAVARYSLAAPVSSGALSAEFAVHVSPGGVGRTNTADRLFFGRPRAGSATYAFVTAEATVEQAVAGSLTWQGQVVLQAGTGALPGLEQIGLGGSAYVRGYTLDDGGYDSAVVVRNALRPRRWRMAPYVFADWGYGRDESARRTAAIGSGGIGLSYPIGRRLRILGEAALSLLDGPRTTAGSARLLARAEVIF